MTVERDWFWFYYALWLASVFTLALVLRQSSENRSITYITHLKDIDIRKDITTIEAEKRKRQEAERTCKDFKWDTFTESARSKS